MSVDEYVKERSAQHLKALDWTQDRVMRLISLHSSGGLGTSMIVMTIMMVRTGTVFMNTVITWPGRAINTKPRLKRCF